MASTTTVARRPAVSLVDEGGSNPEGIRVVENKSLQEMGKHSHRRSACNAAPPAWRPPPSPAASDPAAGATASDARTENETPPHRGAGRGHGGGDEDALHRGGGRTVWDL